MKWGRVEVKEKEQEIGGKRRREEKVEVKDEKESGDKRREGKWR